MLNQKLVQVTHIWHQCLMWGEESCIFYVKLMHSHSWKVTPYFCETLDWKCRAIFASVSVVMKPQSRWALGLNIGLKFVYTQNNLYAIPALLCFLSQLFIKRFFLLLCIFCFISFNSYSISSVQSLSRVRLFATPWIATRQASLSIINSRGLSKLMSIELVMPSSCLILCRPLLLLPPIPPSIRVFSNESTLRMRWPKYWSFSFSLSPSNKYPGLISFRMDWMDLLAVQGTLKSLLQHHSSKTNSYSIVIYKTTWISTVAWS